MKKVLICLIATFGLAGCLIAAAATTPADTRAALEKQLQQIEQEIAQYQRQLSSAKGQANTLVNQIAQLKAKQSALTLQIQATNLQLDDVNARLAVTEDAIRAGVSRVELIRTQLAESVRLIQRQDGIPEWHRILTKGPLADLSSDQGSVLQVTEGINGLLDQAKTVKNKLLEQQSALADEHDAVDNLLSVKLLQQQDLTDATQQQNDLLRATRGKETAYQQAIKDGKAQAAAIRDRIYQLLEVEKQITFGQAVQIANWVSGQTGVRTAFLLAILTQESSLGANVGTCNRPGDPPSKSWRTVMKPDRDQEPFLAITKELGLNPDVTPVSCPMRAKDGSQIGWGGAMGAAQFIPSTWMRYRGPVSQLTGKSPADPWDIRDAFVAAALYLKNAGDDGTRQGEWNAAMRYFSGSTNPQYRFYGDNVLTTADKYQSDITQLNQ